MINDNDILKHFKGISSLLNYIITIFGINKSMYVIFINKYLILWENYWRTWQYNNMPHINIEIAVCNNKILLSDWLYTCCSGINGR